MLQCWLQWSQLLEEILGFYPQPPTMQKLWMQRFVKPSKPIYYSSRVACQLASLIWLRQLYPVQEPAFISLASASNPVSRWFSANCLAVPILIPLYFPSSVYRVILPLPPLPFYSSQRLSCLHWQAIAIMVHASPWHAWKRR
jgi:hypothetical protein